MLSTQPLDRLTTDRIQLREFLNDFLYADRQQLTSTPVEELLEILFRQYYVFLSHPPEAWWNDFKDEATLLLTLIGDDADTAVFRLRSKRFCDYVQTLIKEFSGPSAQTADV